jgi:hypothetical protein
MANGAAGEDAVVLEAADTQVHLALLLELLRVLRQLVRGQRGIIFRPVVSSAHHRSLSYGTRPPG